MYLCEFLHIHINTINSHSKSIKKNERGEIIRARFASGAISE